MSRRSPIVLVVVLVACGACTGTDESSPATTGTVPPSTTVPTDPTTTTPEQAEEAAILAAVDGFVESTFTANDPPDPTHPDLERFRSGKVLELARERAEDRRELGRAFRRPADTIYRSDPVVTAVEGDTAHVRNCIVDDGQVVAIGTGEVLNADVVTKLFETTLTRANAQWRVSENTLVREWEGVAGCAL